jgi:hypothetical protein
MSISNKVANKKVNKNKTHDSEYNDDNNTTIASNLKLLLVTATDISGILHYVGYNQLLFKAEDVLGKVVNPEVIGRLVNGEIVPLDIKINMDAFRTNIVPPLLSLEDEPDQEQDQEQDQDDEPYMDDVDVEEDE